MDPDPTPPPAVPPASSQSLARIALASAVVAVGLWILRDFLAALVWATVLAIAFWPIYRRLRQPVPKPIDRVVAPAIATTLIGIIFIAPIVLIGIAVAHESHFVVQFIHDARHHGIPAPAWLDQLPLVGPTITEWWRGNLGDPVAAEELIGRVLRGAALFHNCARPTRLLSCWQKRPSRGIALIADFRSPPVRQKSDGSGLTSSKR